MHHCMAYTCNIDVYTVASALRLISIWTPQSKYEVKFVQQKKWYKPSFRKSICQRAFSDILFLSEYLEHIFQSVYFYTEPNFMSAFIIWSSNNFLILCTRFCSTWSGSQYQHHNSVDQAVSQFVELLCYLFPSDIIHTYNICVFVCIYIALHITAMFNNLLTCRADEIAEGKQLYVRFMLWVWINFSENQSKY